MIGNVMETTMIILKPDAVQRSLVGRIISRFEDKGLKIVAAKLMQIDTALAEQHYQIHKGKLFFNTLVRYIASGPVLVLAISGHGVIEICRKMIGVTHGAEAELGTIRGDFSVSRTFNLIHASDSPQTARQELALFFEPQHILDYDRDVCRWVAGGGN